MRITFEMVGGPLNGLYVGDSDVDSTVLSWYHASQQGMVGSEFLTNMRSETEKHNRYLVTDCHRADGAIRVTAIHVE